MSIQVRQFEIPESLASKIPMMFYPGDEGVIPELHFIDRCETRRPRIYWDISDTGIQMEVELQPMSPTVRRITLWGEGTMAEAIVISLVDIDSGLTSPPGNYRWMDVADHLYSEDYRNSYDYTQAIVEVTYSTEGDIFQGTLSVFT